MHRRPLSLLLCLLVPFVILAVGVGATVAQGWKAFRELAVESGRGLVPPGFTVDLTEPGKHTLWLHTHTLFDGTAYESGERLPNGARVVLTVEGSADPIPLNAALSARKSFGGDAAVSVGTFDVSSPVRVSVIAAGVSRPVVLSVAPVKMGQTFRAILQVAGTAVISLLLALITLIVLIHRRQRALQAEAGMRHPPAMASPREH